MVLNLVLQSYYYTHYIVDFYIGLGTITFLQSLTLQKYKAARPIPLSIQDISKPRNSKPFAPLFTKCYPNPTPKTILLIMWIFGVCINPIYVNKLRIHLTFFKDGPKQPKCLFTYYTKYDSVIPKYLPLYVGVC